MIIFNVCAASWTSYLLDGVILLFILGFTFVCARKGFIECFLGFVSTMVAAIAAFSLAKVLASATGGFFGLQKVMESGFTKVFSKISGFDVDVSALGVKEAVKDKQLPVVLVSLVMKVFGKGELEAGTTVGSMLGVSVSKFAITLLCGILIFAVVKFGIFLLKKLLGKVVEKIKVLGSVDALLGGVIGVVESVLIVCLVLSVLTVIPSRTVSSYLDNSLFVGLLYNYNPLVHILAWML